MSKNILIIGRKQEPSEDGPEQMASAMNARSLGEVYTPAYFEDLLFECNGSNVVIQYRSLDLSDFDAILCINWFKISRPFEDTANALSNYALRNGITMFNSETLHRSKSKLSQYVLFALNDLPYPHTIFSHDNELLIDRARKTFSFPYIIKTTNGSRGEHNYLVRSESDIQQVRQAMHDSGRPFCAQEFIPNDGDLRVLVMNNLVRLVIHRNGQEGTHLNNTSQGGRAKLINVEELPHTTKMIALGAARCLRREVCGVDIMFSSETGEPYLLEVNNMPQLVTGSFVDEKMTALAEMFHE